MNTYPLNYFVDNDKRVVEKAELFSLTSIENFELTLEGLIAKMVVWDEQYHGVEEYIYDITKKDIEEAGGTMPNDIRRGEKC